MQRTFQRWLTNWLQSQAFALTVIVAITTASPRATAETVAQCGAGWLEVIDGYMVLHLKGSPYEMGYQQGALLKEHCRANLDYLLNSKGRELFKVGPLPINPKPFVLGIIEMQREFVPERYFQEMDGLADGAGLSHEEVYVGNFIPELFHCSGFAVMNSATQDGTLYHGRVLDYSCDWRLQEHAVLVVAEPDGGVPFVNVTYAGFIGSVTGMNAEHISIGEMGGLGIGHWSGVPMSLLMREVLQTTHSLEQAVAVFQKNPRTCTYYYVIADGETNEAVGVATNWEKVITIKPGEAHALLPSPVKDAVLLSAGDRYHHLVKCTETLHGRIDAQAAQHLMDRPVAMRSNLHNVLFAPQSTKLWVANASLDGEPAADQSYREFQLTELLQRRPEGDTTVLPLPTNSRATATSILE